MRTIVLVAAAILAASFYISSPLAGIHSGGGARGMASASATEPCVGEIDANQCPVWVETFSNPGGQNGSCMGLNVPQGAAVGPSDVYVTGYSCDSNDHGLAGNDIFTIAYDQATGAQRWVARYSGPGAPGDAIGDSGWGVAVSPAGDRVYVTGGQNGGLGSGPSGDFRFVSDYVTIAYDAATGNQLWVASYHGPAAGPDEAEQIAVSEDGLRVFVTGESQAPDVDGRSGGSEVATISYDAQTGAQDWVFRHRVSTAPPQPGDRNNAIGVSSLAVHGSRVYTAGAYALSGVGAGYEILALLDDRDAHEGRLLWAASSDPAINYRLARDSLAITPSGVILTGSTSSTVGPPDTCPPQQTSGAANSQYATVALDPDTGAIRWSATYAGQTGGNNAAFSLAANPSGDRVFVTGQASGAAPTCAIGFATISYDAETGQQEWLTSETVPPGIAPQAFAVAASPDGDQVFVAGLEYHVETMGEKGDSRIIGYDANTGTLRWSGRYNTGTLVGATDLDLPYLVRVSADSSRVFVAEKAIRNIQYQIDNTRFAFGTLAYDTSPATSQQYAAHAPIFIDGADPTAGFVITDPATGQVNWDLTRATTGVVSGDGSAANPFVIEQWTILIDPSFVTSKVFEARSTGTSGLFESYGVEVRNTNAHFVIRDVEVVGETPPTLSTVGYGADHVWVGGIRLLGTGNATIERVDVHDGHRGIWAERAPDLVLRDCSAHDNHDSNALSYQFAYGMVIKNSPRALVENCDVHDNDGWGVYVSTSPDARLSNVTAHHMYGYYTPFMDSYAIFGGVGIVVSSSDRAILQDCSAHDNVIDGLRLAESVDARVSGCTVESNGWRGIVLSGSYDGRDMNGILENCVVASNGAGTPTDFSSPGVAIGERVRGFTVRGCDVRSNAGPGIGLYGNSFTGGGADGNTITGNVLEGNTVGLQLTNDGDSRPSGNLFYDNYVNETTPFAFAFPSSQDANHWNVTKTPGPNIVGGPFLGGNAWETYKGYDTDGDSLGDTLTPFGPGDAHPLVPVGRVDRFPIEPWLPTPSDAATRVGLTPLLEWSSADPDGDPLTFDVYFGTDASDLPLVEQGSPRSAFEPGALAHSTTYSWKVVVHDTGGLSATSPTWAFTTRAASEDQPPSPPIVLKPTDGAAATPPDPTLRVRVSDLDGDRMNVQLFGRARGDAAFQLIGTQANVASGGEASVSWPSRAYATTYEWYARADDGDAATVSSVWSFTTREAPPLSNLPALAPHAPIDIESDADFTPENGVTGGTGAPDDPYVIEGWDIQGAGQVTAVYIKGTTAHFVVRNVYVHDSYSGVSLVGAVNARIENVVASGNDLFGIGLFDVTGALVQGCSALDSPIGIEIVHGSGNTIVGCDAHGNTGTDLIIDGSPHNNLRANAIGATFKVNPQDGPEPLAGYEQDIDPSNTIGGKPIVYLVGTDGALVDGATMNVGLVTLVHARNVTLLNLDLTQQVLLADVTDSTISKCEVSSPANGNILDASNAGILLIGSSRNAITDCDLHDNAYGLLMLDGSNDNVVTRLIAHNNTGSINSYGVVVDASSGNRIEDCRLADNMVGGLRLVSSNQNVIDGCTAWATPGNEDGGTYGFVVEDSSWNSLKNVVTNLPWDGILLTDSPNNTIEDCLTTRAGIELKDGSNDNVVTGCTLGGELSWFAGIGIDSSTRNVLRNNAITENGGLSIDKWSWNGGFPPDESDFVQDIDASNTIDGKPILYLVGQRDLVLDSPDVGYLGIVASNNITINDVTLDHPNTEGLLLVNVQNVTVERCRIEAQGIGIAAFRARDSTVSHCTIDDGSTGTIHSGGIWLVDSAGGIVLSNVTANGISLRGTNGATIRDCDVTSMRIMDSNSNTVTNCAVHGVSNSAKIQLLRSSSNTLAHCLVSDSSWVGLQMSLASNGNTIDQCVLRDNVLGLLVSTNNNLMRNNVFANRLPGIGEIVHLGDTGISPPMGVGQAADGGTGNAWNGNYWTDYYGVDQDGDGRGDTPHRWAAVYQIGVNTKTDDLPWMDPVAGSGPAPVVSFAYAMHGHQALQFTDWSMSPGGTLVSWAWSFGDGSGAGTSQEQNPIYRYASAGTYQVSLTVTDDQGRSATHVTSLTVREGNEPPVIAHPGHKTIAEAAPLAFLIAVSDADRDTVRVSATSLPAGASYDDSARTFSWVPSFDQAGTYAVTFTANDGALDTSISVDITVVNVNRAPVLATVIDRAGREGDAIGFTLSATDPDGDSPAYSGEGLPTGASVNSVSGAFTWTPSYQQAGSYSLRFVATDGTLSDAKTATLVITNVQRAPVLTPIGNKATFEGAALSVSVSASDPENDALTLLASPLPAGASFTDRHDGSGVFSWTPGAHARGDYAVTFRATDGIAEAIETIAIRVAATNGVPSFTPIGNRTVSEADQLNFVVSAIDSNGDTLTYSATNVPRGASFDANRRVFSWQPDFAQAGTHIVAFRVTDGTTSVTENATINVTNVNRAPIVSGATSATVKAARTLNMVAPIVDPDGDALDYVFTGLPEGASSTGGIITWRPTSAQVGNYSVLVHATDGAFATQATLTIAVIENLAPLVSVSAPAAAEVLVLTNFMANASDPDGTSTPAIAWDFDATDGFQAQRTGANVTWAFPATGTFTVTARATDADGMLTTQTFSVSVDDNVALLIEALEQATDGTTNARATVTNWDGSGIANATVTVNVYYEPIAGAGKVLLRTLTVTTGEDGSVLFDIPQDTPLANLKGTHVLEASAVTQTSLGGDQETAEDMDEYTS